MNIKHITEYPNYYITDAGVVFNKNNKKLSPWIVNSGYYTVGLMKDGRRKNNYIHRLVAIYFLNEGEPTNLVVNHKDGNKLNNNVSNLELITQLQNNIHAYETGLKLPTNEKCEFNGNSKLTTEDVNFIRTHYKKRGKEYSGVKLAEQFNVTPATICDIIRGKRWIV